MIDARALLEAGGLTDAFARLKQDVRQAPRDPRLRTFLFQMFCISGEWERALTQLTVAAELDPLALPMAEAYRTLIRCEGVRETVFAGRRTPTVFGHPLPWIPSLIEANRLLATGAHEAASQLRDDAFSVAEGVSGTADDAPFEWIADADPRLGPVLEAILDGTYYWIPFQHIANVVLEPPADLRDKVWMPVEFTWTNGGQAIGFVPTRYPGSTGGDPSLALARRTEWVADGPADAGWALGRGQRMLTTGDTDIALMDLRVLAFDAAAPAA